MNSDDRAVLLGYLEDSLREDTFVKMSLGNYKGGEPGLKQILIKRIIIKKEQKLSFTYRYQTRDIVKNYAITEAVANIKGVVGEEGFRHAGLFTTSADFQFEIDNKGKARLKRSEATITEAPSLSHDRAKVRLIAAENKPYLHKLNITDRDGKVYSHAQDKYKQINHFVQIVDSLLKHADMDKVHRVADMGSGKGYLSFALYDYLNNVLNIEASLTGVELRKDMADLCNKIAKEVGFDRLDFKEDVIERYDSTGTDILIALHACDTATDDAIWKGIATGAQLIMVAPCCHKQIRREMEKNKKANELDFLTKYGIFLERQAEMVTDGIRALILEYYGYTTRVFDFITDAHTPKNVMIAAVKNKTAPNQQDILAELKRIKAYFGIGQHYLERLAGI
jgi:tRNA A58 N-methylase Trm61